MVHVSGSQIVVHVTLWGMQQCFRGRWPVNRKIKQPFDSRTGNFIDILAIDYLVLVTEKG